MKVLFWTDGFWPRVGGIETQALQFIENMQEKGHQFLVIAHKETPDRREDETYKGIPIKRFAFDTILAKRELHNLRPIREYLDWVMTEFQPDIVHLNLCIGWGALAYLMLKAALYAPTILTIHVPFVYVSRTGLFFKEVCASVDQICCVSNSIMEDTLQLVPNPKNALKLIYNGLPMPDTSPSSLSFSPPTLLLLGRLSQEKGFDTAIRAFSLLKKSGCSANLIIAGDGFERSNLEHLVSEMGLTHSVQFTGELDRDKIPSIINQATIVVVPSHFEAFGLVALEAMQMGRPVIASEVGGLKEIINDHATGLLIPPQDTEALFQALQYLIDNPEIAIKMGQEGRKIAMEKFTLHQNVSLYENLYNELAGAEQ